MNISRERKEFLLRNHFHGFFPGSFSRFFQIKLCTDRDYKHIIPTGSALRYECFINESRILTENTGNLLSVQ